MAVAIRKENFVGREEGWLLNGGGNGESSQHGRRKQKKPSDVAGRGREGENIISLSYSPHQKKEGDDFFLSLFVFPSKLHIQSRLFVIMSRTKQGLHYGCLEGRSVLF